MGDKRQAVLDRVVKLIRLSNNNPNSNESASALEKARVLMDRHRLTFRSSPSGGVLVVYRDDIDFSSPIGAPPPVSKPSAPTINPDNPFLQNLYLASRLLGNEAGTVSLVVTALVFLAIRSFCQLVLSLGFWAMSQWWALVKALALVGLMSYYGFLSFHPLTVFVAWWMLSESRK